MKFEFDIEPVEQARPRAIRMGKGIRLYDPKKVTVFKRQLGMLARQQMLDRGLKPFDGPLEVCMEFYRPVQASLSQKERARRLSGFHRPTVKPDLDNYIKSTSDALNGILWVDDNLIISLEAKKYYAEQPHLVVEVKRLTILDRRASNESRMV
ncbi:RusA family crossover junction endodeoxyribonuclease [Limosilactobacillus fermentum]|uniref:RusA family crossover junction endodeoxyribonuclease n=1 Tax=Limosilactobacillus fermentum TaxID=1613 RepID=UPI00070C9B1E|nr:RusA family crossover junction endodeoxyribonuclease [Limosilactobacillus fermentum]MCH5389218.1 RusA family crossover junction endodeoxyribonuclease [Limosilactobacillus fermentum]MCH5393755.1 RusA family crossover junction endodeoxyribonuclease [Limosilactobacillus fermentum]MCT3435917.1 RusA family crossover junction endodeoxyribonuclease [Limosilactobacillus fermentum]PPX65450.1 RusA family crossover junction endodeoxyribonuclease [Limosilactobacillus fermentum]